MPVLIARLTTIAALTIGVAHASCGLSIDASQRIPGQDPITAKVINQLSGTWVEDNIEFVYFLASIGALPQDQLQRALAEAKQEARENPPEPWITFRADGTFTWPSGSSAAKFVVRDWVIDLPEGDYCAQVYSIKGRIFRGSREFGFIPLKRTPAAKKRP